MLKNHNDNIICRFFKAMAALWSSAAEYQIFVILAAVAMLTILPLFKTELNDTTDVIFNIIIFCALAVAGFLLFRLKGSQMAAFTFAIALLLRLSLVFVLENSTPNMLEGIRVRTSPWIKHYDSVLFQPDEYFYFYYGQKYKDTTISEFTSSPQFKDHGCRSGFLLSRIFRFFGEQSLWPRLVGTFLGAFAAAIICLAAKELFGKETVAIVSMLSALAPQTAFFSVRFLKEIWVIFAVSIIVLGFAMIIRSKKLIPAIVAVAAGGAVLLWVRVEYGLMFITAVPVALCFRYKSSPIKIITVAAMVILFGVIIFTYQFNQMADKAEYLLNKFSIENDDPVRLEVMEEIYKSRGLLRIVNIPLAVLNLPPKNLHCIYTEENKLYDIIRLADIYQWWLPLPFLIIGTVITIGRRREFLVLLLPYIIVISIAALLLGGLTADFLRYRDSLAPVTFIIIGVGIESFITEKKTWKNIIILSVYALFALLAVYFYIRDF
jgi:hypothetical protein